MITILRNRYTKGSARERLLCGKTWHDARMRKPRRLDDAYRFTGFRPEPTFRGVFGDPKARILRLLRPGKKRPAGPVGGRSEPTTTARPVACATSPGATPVCTWRSRSGACPGRSCGAVKQEKLPWLANNPFYTRRFAFYVGRRCRSATIRDVARELRLDWKTVKALEMESMREQLRRAGAPGPKVIGIDEISIGKGHNYRIVVSDRIRGRPIWFGGTDRSEKSMDLFSEWLGPRKCRGIRRAVMDMWKPFRNSTRQEGNAPQAGILYDKFPILKPWNEALDKVRKSESPLSR